jgi:hypothetical protein
MMLPSQSLRQYGARQAQYLGQIFEVARARDSIASCK